MRRVGNPYNRTAACRVRDKNEPWVLTPLQQGLELAQGLCNDIT